MRKSLTILLAAGLLLFPFATVRADYGSQPSQTQQVPPVAQSLVREGDFAVKLAAALEIGSPESEAEATDLLARAGIVPLNGWISDYPMTPAVLGELQDAIAKAGSEGKLPIGVDEATRRLFDLAQAMDLPVPAGPETEGAAAAEQSYPSVVNNYYYDYGPPIITYYPPPTYYAYLYAWVPYPVWWFGFWFPGYYICNDFTTVVVVRSRPLIVTNRFIDPVTKRHAVLAPIVKRDAKGTVKPLTMFRTEDGRTFKTLFDMKKEAGRSGLRAGRPDTPGKRAFRTEGFKSPEARKSAEAIFSRSVGRMTEGRGPEGRMVREEKRRAAPGPAERSYRHPATRGSGDPGRPYVAPRSPSKEGGKRFIAPGRGERSFKPPVTRRGGESGRSFVPPRATERSLNGPRARSGERRYAAPQGSARTFNAPMRTGERPFVAPAPGARSFKGPVIDGERGFERRFFDHDRRGR
jgi:hypothetical protein